MHTVYLPEANLTRYIPADLSECDKFQYIDMCELIFRFHNQEIDYQEFRTHAVYKLMGLKAAKASLEDEDKFSNVYMVSELIDSFFEENDGVKTIKQYYINNPVPEYAPAFSTYYGPSDSFMNMTFGEYRDALRIFHDFHATGDMQLLVLLTAIFYRKKKSFLFIKKQSANYDGNIRVPYNSATLEKHAENFKYAPIGFVYGFYLLFASFQKYLVDAKLLWSGREIDLSILFDGSSASNDNDIPGIGMDSIAFTMAESGAFGNIKEVDNTNFWQILIKMYDSRRNDLERQKQEQNATNK
ncbi:hypothetical protein [Flavobacterium nitratireducens]|uniref:hypothetical protein n=1 Tax=Flavobacterium nitratireducens TaxID=992289 RepID=UPI0024153579|nr:hypothetical protein [Flavobacterium nitratireducens]